MITCLMVLVAYHRVQWSRCDGQLEMQHIITAANYSAF